MKKVRYYKAIKEGKKQRFVESWGEPLKVNLPSGAVINCACEFVRGDGWRVTDTSTGFLMQNRQLANKKDRDGYFKNPTILEVFERNLTRDYYKQAQQKLQEYQSQFM